MGLNTKLKFNLDLKEINDTKLKKLQKELVTLFKKYNFELDFTNQYSVNIKQEKGVK